MDKTLRIAIILSATDRMNKTVNEAVNKANAKLTAFGNKASNLADNSFKNGQQMIAAGLAVGAPLYKATEIAEKFETKMIDIRKQMQEDTPAAVKAMTNEVFKLGKELPLATESIQDMIAAGLRMGVAQDKIIGFTRDVTKMSVAFDMDAGEIADSMGKIANVYKIPIDKIGGFADAINYLDDNTMAKGRDLIDVLQRMGGSSKNIAPNNAAALASTMLSMGETSETAGTSISSMINRLSAASMQSRKFRDGMGMLGLDVKKVQQGMSSPLTAQNTILEVFEKIQGLNPNKQSEALVRLFGMEHAPKLAKLANNVAEYKRQLLLVQGAEKGSMSKEYAKRIAGAAAQKQIFRNRITEIGVKFGTTLLPAINSFLARMGIVLDRVGKFIDENPKLVKWLGLAAAGFSALALVGGYLSFVVGGVARFFSIATRVFTIVTRVIGFVSKAFQVLRIIIMLGGGPILLIIGAVAAAAFLVIKYWDKIKAFFSHLWNFTKAIFKNAWEWLKRMFMNYTPHGLIIKHWDKIKNFFSGLWDRVKEIFFNHFKWVMGLGKRFFDAGKNIVKSIWEGIKAFANKPIEAISGIVKKIRNFLPFSPAKEGALRDIHRIRLVETIAENVKPAPLQKAIKRVTSVAFGEMNAANGRTQLARGGGGNQFSFNVAINLSGSATAEDANMISKEFITKVKAAMKQISNNQLRTSF